MRLSCPFVPDRRWTSRSPSRCRAAWTRRFRTVSAADATPLKLQVVGPPGSWKVASVRGASIEPSEGGVPGTVVVTPANGSIVEGVPPDHLALTAEGDVELPAGKYTLRAISDDGVRVYVDANRVIDRWTEHESALDTAPLSEGRHHLRVEYFQLTGFAELRVEILKNR